MNKVKRIFVVIASLICVLLIGTVIVAYLFPGFGWVLGIAIGGGCDARLKQQLNSPNNDYVAKVISRDCGALATGQTYVEVKRQSLFDSPTVALEILGPDHDKEIKLSWKSSTALQIYYEGYLSEIQNISYKVGKLTIETFAREKVLTENYIRKAGDDGGYIPLVDYNGRPSPVPSPS